MKRYIIAFIVFIFVSLFIQRLISPDINITLNISGAVATGFIVVFALFMLKKKQQKSANGSKKI